MVHILIPTYQMIATKSLSRIIRVLSYVTRWAFGFKGANNNNYGYLGKKGELGGREIP